MTLSRYREYTRKE